MQEQTFPCMHIVESQLIICKLGSEGIEKNPDEKHPSFYACLLYSYFHTDNCTYFISYTLKQYGW